MMTGTVIPHSGQDTTSGEVLQPLLMYSNKEKIEVACTSECGEFDNEKSPCQLMRKRTQKKGAKKYRGKTEKRQHEKIGICERRERDTKSVIKRNGQ